MADFQTDMNRLVSSFVADITELARRAAIQTLESALGRTLPSAGRRVVAARGGKRAPEDINRLQEQFVSFVTKNPGLRIEQTRNCHEGHDASDPEAHRRRNDQDEG